MAMTHGDRDHGPLESDALRRLRERAVEMQEKRLAEITVGAPNEAPLWERERDGMQLTRMPEDPDCLRISMGKVRDDQGLEYLVFRGPPGKVLELLDHGAKKLRAAMGQ